MKNFSNLTITEYLEDLSAGKAVPGGGSAAALSAALGAALNLMVIRYSIKKTSADVDLNELKKRELEENQNLKRTTSFINEDSEVFSSLREAFLNKKADKEKEYTAAAKVPIEICRSACRSLRVTEYLAARADKNLMTDVECAAHMLRAAFFSAKINAEINLKYVKDELFSQESRAELEKMEQSLQKSV